MSDPSTGIIYIMKNDYWGDTVRSKPTHKNNGYTNTPIDRFMIEAISWESFLHTVYKTDAHPGKFVHFLLDVYVCSMKRYHDMFANLF